MARTFMILAAVNALLAVALGAFGAHSLKELVSEDLLSIFNTGTHYHLTHALGLGIVAIVTDKYPRSSLLYGSGWLLFSGIVIFSGSLYAMTFTDIRALGAITPIGGVCFIVGWLLLAIAAGKNFSRQK